VIDNILHEIKEATPEITDILVFTIDVVGGVSELDFNPVWVPCQYSALNSVAPHACFNFSWALAP
jgi:hypothetical protein